MRFLICLMMVMAISCSAPAPVDGDSVRPIGSTLYDFSQHDGKTVHSIRTGRHGKDIYVTFKDGLIVKLEAYKYEIKVQEQLIRGN